MIIQSQAIVLKSFSYSNTSIIARCLTREMGKISVIVHGAKKKNLQKSAYFQPASYVDLVFYFKETREIQTVSKASFVQTWPHLQNDLKKIAYVLSVIELTDKTVIDRDPHKELFDELVSVIRIFDSRDDRLNLVFWHFELRLLSLLGFKPDFEKRDFSGLTLPNPFAGPNSRELLNGLQNNDSDSLKEIPITKKDRAVISDYLTTYLKYHFDGLNKLKSFEVLKQILV